MIKFIILFLEIKIEIKEGEYYMHTAEIMKSSDFSFSIDGKKCLIDDIFKGFNEQDRLGIIVSKAGGAAGTSALLMAAVTRFYDFYRSNLGEKKDQIRIYPDFFIFHLDQLWFNSFFMDIWPPHKNVVVKDDPEQILEAVNDRGITRLIVEDIKAVEAIFLKETLNSAKFRLKTAIAYSSSGRTNNGNIEITSCKAAEKMLISSLNRSQALTDIQRTELINKRKNLLRNGRIVESYKSLDINQALKMLTKNNVQSETTKKYFKML